MINLRKELELARLGDKELYKGFNEVIEENSQSITNFLKEKGYLVIVHEDMEKHLCTLEATNRIFNGKEFITNKFVFTWEDVSMNYSIDKDGFKTALRDFAIAIYREDINKLKRFIDNDMKINL